MRLLIIIHYVKTGVSDADYCEADMFCELWRMEYPDYNWDFSLLDFP